MDIPIHVKFPENIQENEINNINNESNIKYDEFYQVKYENSLKESQKNIYNKQKNGDSSCSNCCCGKNQIKYMYQFLTLYIILCCLILCSKIFQVGSIEDYKIARNEIFSKIQLLSTGFTPCFYEQSFNRIKSGNCSTNNAYVINYSLAQYLCDFNNYEKGILFTSLIFLIFSLLFYIISIKIFKNKINSKGIYYNILLTLLMILYAIFSINSILFCYLFVYFFIFLIGEFALEQKIFFYGCADWDKEFSEIHIFNEYWKENNHASDFLLISSQLSWSISIFSLFLLIPIKKLIISHINLENNELNEKYKKSVFYIKDKKFDIEIKIDDELVLKFEEKYYLFKEVKIKEIKKNENIYILINNEYIKDELSITDLKLYNMNIEIGRLGDLINLIIVILIILIGLFQIFSKNEYEKIFFDDTSEDRIFKFYHEMYPITFQIYKYFEYYKEITEFFVCLFMLLLYCFCFFKRLFTGGIKTQDQINIYKSIFKSFNAFNFIYMILSFFLLSYGFVVYGINDTKEITDFMKLKVLIHSSLNSIIMILYIVIIVKNFRVIKYMNNIEKEMNLINNEKNNPKNIKFTDLYNLTHILKPIIYNNYEMNLFYELEGEKLNNKMNKERIDSEINDLKE